MMNNEDRYSFLEQTMIEHGFHLDPAKINQLIRYYDMVVEKNQVMNLTNITEFHEFVYKHLLDSIYLGKYMDLTGNKKMIDIGTGAGFPGIPIKIVYTKSSITLLDSLNKRVKFLSEVIAALNLHDIEAVHARAEELARNKEYRESYDLAVSRAVANLSTLTEITLPFLKTGGIFVSYKSLKGIQELEEAGKAIKLLGGDSEQIDIKEFKIEAHYDHEQEKNTEILDRNLIMIHKIKNTPNKYPRKPGTPFKEPIK